MKWCSRVVEILLWLLLLGVILWLSLIPPDEASPAVRAFGGDKIAHFLAYAALAWSTYLLVTPGLRRRYRIFVTIGSGVLLGIVIEYIQPYFGRGFEFLDIVINTGGTVFGVVIALVLLRIVPEWFP